MIDCNHMSVARGSSAAVSWVGRVLQPLPLWPLQRLATIVMAGMVQRHQESFLRLRTLGSSCFLIDPTDCPFVMAVWPGLDKPRLVLIARADRAPDAIAFIRGSMASFLALLEGREDGDALFFSRELSIDGDMAAVLSLRNAIDGAEVDFIRDVCASCGPFAGLFEKVLRFHDRAARHLVGLEADIRRALLEPTTERVAQHEAPINDPAAHAENSLSAPHRQEVYHAKR